MLTGGGSRADIESLVPLRAISAILLALALWFQDGKSLRRVVTPLIVIVVLALCIAIQLVPLPPSIWTSLPGRETIASLGELAGMPDIWRPITFSPMKTANSLASLVVPLAGLMLLALMGDKEWKRLPWVFISAGVASSLFGVAQILSSIEGLYLYEITNDGSAVGLFSNRNHNAMFLSVALLFCLFRIERVNFRSFTAADLVALTAALVIFVGLLINASRFGLVGMGLVGLIFAVRTVHQSRGRKGEGRLRIIVGAVFGLLSLFLVGLFVLLGSSPAVERLLQQDLAADQRVQTLDVVLDMLVDFQPLGVGFGAFEHAFRTVETDELLQDRYLNNAHNDWLQFPIEGGVPAILLGLAVIALLAARIFHIARTPAADTTQRQNAWLGAFTIGIFALGSIVDYPVRTPSIMLVLVAAAAMLFKPIAVRTKG